ncbi:hypothetical protein [Gordonia aichiensis]|uniref:hypothetical protein n=1 Tax=Gordonia aichiensis TaxID=36820 RepID=UPI00326498AD
MVDVRKWKFWQFLDDEGEIAWVGVSRPDAHARIDRVKIWTLLPAQQRLIANWYLSHDYQLPEDQRQWVHDSIDGWSFLEVAALAPEPSKEEVQRLARPEAVLTFDQIDDIALDKVTGKRDLQQIVKARARR